VAVGLPPRMTPDRLELQRKRQRVEDDLARFGRVVVAFSGGVDSTLLAALGRAVLGKRNLLAATADSPSLSRRDLAYACQLAVTLDLEHTVVATREVTTPSYQANTERRCYVCKQELFSELGELARQQGFPMVLYGAIGDDLLAERPGQLAARDYGVKAPLQEAGFAKADVRELARLLGLPNWDRPQNACLASRIPHGMGVTEEKLQQVEQAEAVLLGLGFRQVRVRHLGSHARIEVGLEEIPRFQDVQLCRDVGGRFARLGFRSVGVDRRGYRAGGADKTTIEEQPLVTSD